MASFRRFLKLDSRLEKARNKTHQVSRCFSRLCPNASTWRCWNIRLSQWALQLWCGWVCSGCFSFLLAKWTLFDKQGCWSESRPIFTIVYIYSRLWKSRRRSIILLHFSENWVQLDSNSWPHYTKFAIFYSSLGATSPICRRSCERMQESILVEQCCKTFLVLLRIIFARVFRRKACLLVFIWKSYPISENLIPNNFQTFRAFRHLKI